MNIYSEENPNSSLEPELDQRTVDMEDEILTLKANGALVSAGTRINWNGAIKRAAVDLWDNAESTPDAAPTLWEDISYKDGYRIIPETITATLAFAQDEIGWWKDEKYKSLIPANTYTPEQYPAGWEIVE